MSEPTTANERDAVRQDMLPLRPEDWTFVAVGGCVAADALHRIADCGFKTTSAAELAEVEDLIWSGRVVLLADTAWLSAHARFIHALLPRNDAAISSTLLVALGDRDDLTLLAQARQIGARLWLDLPLNAPRLLAELAGLAWLPRAPYRVLLVDDDELVLNIHQVWLEEAGCQVLALSDPLEAVQATAEFAPDVCVFDVEMPACRGTDLAALLRREARHAQLPILFHTAWDDMQHQLDARLAGGEDYLVKPVDARLLKAAVISRARRFRLYRLEQSEAGQAIAAPVAATRALPVQARPDIPIEIRSGIMRKSRALVRVKRQEQMLVQINQIILDYLLDARRNTALAQLLDVAMSHGDSPRGFLTQHKAGEAARILACEGWPEEDVSEQIAHCAATLGSAAQDAAVIVTDAEAAAILPESQALLCLTLRHEGETQGMLILADRPGGYDPDLSDEFQPLVKALTGLLVAGRAPRAGLAAETAPVQEVASSGRHRILVAEDDRTIRAVLRMQLQSLGHDCELAADGQEAFERWRQSAYDLVLTDRHMPNMDGIALAQAIRRAEDERGGHTTIIAVSAFDNPADKTACLDAGMDDVLAKPIDLERLRHTLAYWLAAREGDALNGAPALDQAQLLHVVGQGGLARMREVIAMFVQTARADLDDYRGKLEAQDWAGLAAAMHKTKSSARMVGAQRYAAIAVRLETVARACREDEAIILLRQLEAALNEVEHTARTANLPTH